MTPDLVLVGHIAQDAQPDGSFRLGGTVTYAALLAQRLGLRVATVTSASDATLADYTALLPDIQIANVPTPTPTIFANSYHEHGRQQVLRARANPITAVAIPPEWYKAPIILLGPIANEIALDVPPCFTGDLRGATIQGWLRGWDANGRVYPMGWESAPALLPYLNALILSVEDLATAAGGLAQDALLQQWASKVSYIALTAGSHGATIWSPHMPPFHTPAFPVPEIDPTGAGDCFAIAFLIALQRTGDVAAAARYAHAAASFVVQAPGIAGIPTATMVAAKVADVPRPTD